MIKKCTLCGGRLSNGKCEFCGLDNTLFNQNHINDLLQTPPASSTSAKKATPRIQAPPGRTSSGRASSGSAPYNRAPSGSVPHNRAPSGSVPYNRTPSGRASYNRASSGSAPLNNMSSDRQWKSSVRRRTPESSPKKKLILSLLIAIAAIFLCALLPALFRTGENLTNNTSDSGIPFTTQWDTDRDYSDDLDLDFVYDYLDSYDYDPYSYVTRAIPESGDSYETVLGSGAYIVGVHIPEGIYTAELSEGAGSFHITDEENIIYEYFSFGDDEEYDEISYQDDIRLYNGARVDIDDPVFLTLTTDNAQPLVQETVANPLAGSEVSLSEGTYIIGENLEEGIYDLYLESGSDSSYSSLDVAYPDGDTDYLWMSNSSYNEIQDYYLDHGIKNIVLPAGTELVLEGESIILRPSENYFDIESYSQ